MQQMCPPKTAFNAKRDSAKVLASVYEEEVWGDGRLDTLISSTCAMDRQVVNFRRKQCPIYKRPDEKLGPERHVA
jgi:hypothetical protein